MATVVTEPQTKHADRMIMPSSSQTTCRGQGSDLPFAHAQFTCQYMFSSLLLMVACEMLTEYLSIRHTHTQMHAHTHTHTHTHHKHPTNTHKCTHKHNTHLPSDGSLLLGGNCMNLFLLRSTVTM